MSFTAYRHLFATFDKYSPASFGLNSEDYKAALSNAKILGIHLTDSQKRKITFPLLSPVSEWPWMSKEYYLRNFRDEENYYLSVPSDLDTENIESYISQTVNQIESVKKDHPALRITIDRADDSKYPVHNNVITMLLVRLGINEDKLQKLGHQTFYAGKFIPKNDHLADPQLSHSTMRTALKDLHNGPVMFFHPQKDIRQDLWEKYQNVMGYLNKYNPAQETMDKKHFLKMLTDPQSAVFAYVHKGTISSVCIMSSDFELFDWLNKDYYQSNFESYMRSSNVYVFPLIFTEPSLRGLNHAKSMIKHVAETIAHHEQSIIFAFDSNEKASKIIPKLIQKSVNSSNYGSVELSPVGYQEYLSFSVD